MNRGEKYFLKLPASTSEDACRDSRQGLNNLQVAAGVVVVESPLYFDEPTAAMICPFIEGRALRLDEAKNEEVISTVFARAHRLHTQIEPSLKAQPNDFGRSIVKFLARIEQDLPAMPECARNVARALNREYDRLPSVAPTLVHGDLHFGSVLMQSQNHVRLIDFFCNVLRRPGPRFSDLDVLSRHRHHPGG